MRFTFSNKEQLDKQYIHDSEFEGYNYDYDKRQISFSCIDGFGIKKIYLTFNNVIYSEMQSCQFWDGANSIYAMWSEEKSKRMLELLSVLNENKERYDMNCLTEGINYIEVALQLNSGDKLFIICESVDWTEDII